MVSTKINNHLISIILFKIIQNTEYIYIYFLVVTMVMLSQHLYMNNLKEMVLQQKDQVME